MSGQKDNNISILSTMFYCCPHQSGHILFHLVYIRLYSAHYRGPFAPGPFRIPRPKSLRSAKNREVNRHKPRQTSYEG